MQTIQIKYFADIPKMEKITQGDWIDLRASVDVTLLQGQSAIIPLGVGMKLPQGYEAHVVPRSSTFKTWGILQTNGMGVIDYAYCGNEDQWGMPVLAMRDTKIHKGDRICQFRIFQKMEEIAFEEVEVLDLQNRGGFGSTGTK